MAEAMLIKAIAPWFGGKRTLAPDIVAELGEHTQYFEPFCGSMAVLFAKKRSQKETVNDLHGDLVNLAWVLQSIDEAEQLYDRCSRTVMSEGLLEQARDVLEDDSARSIVACFSESVPAAVRVERAYWYFIASWMGRNGTAGTERLDYQIAVRWTRSGGSPTVRFKNAVESIPAWHDRLRNVVVLRRDAFRFIDRFEDAVGTAVYVDPPYPAETRSNIGDGDGVASKGGGGGRYLHEFRHNAGALFDGEDDHARLASALRTYKHARIVVSTYDCERYRRLYEGWTFIGKARHKHLHAQNGRGARQKLAPELLIVNGRSFTDAKEGM